jgi:N-acetylmuramoyl-L-alanine amidase
MIVKKRPAGATASQALEDPFQPKAEHHISDAPDDGVLGELGLLGAGAPHLDRARLDVDHALVVDAGGRSHVQGAVEDLVTARALGQREQILIRVADGGRSSHPEAPFSSGGSSIVIDPGHGGKRDGNDAPTRAETFQVKRERVGRPGSSEAD